MKGKAMKEVPQFNAEYYYQLMTAHTKTFEQACKESVMLTSPTDNPYWEIVKSLPGEDWDFLGGWQPKNFWVDQNGNAKMQREQLVRDYAWAIPDPMTLQFIVEHAQGHIIELGAGTGYWAYQLSQFHIDVVAFDVHPPHASGKNYYHCPRDSQAGELTGEVGKSYFDVQTGTPEILTQHADRTLFLCWPPYESSMATECLKHYQGNRLIYIGEGDGGCTADDEFHQMLENEWEEVASHRPIQWEGIHDWVYVHERIANHDAV